MARKRAFTAHRKRDTAKAQARFLKAYEQLGTIVHAADKARISRRAHYDWLENNPAYAERFEQSEEIAIQTLEREMRRRAIEGVQEPILYQGKVVARVKKYSDTLLIFALKAKRREVYADRHEHTGKDGKPLYTEPSKMTDEELAAELRVELAKLEKRGL